MLYFVFCLLLQLQIGIRISAHVQIEQGGQRFRAVALIPPAKCCSEEAPKAAWQRSVDSRNLIFITL